MKKIKLISNKIDNNSLALIAGNMADLYDSGISFLLIMDLLLELPIKKHYKESVIEIKNDIKLGKSLEESFGKYNKIYPEFFIGMISVGEKSGNLNSVLRGIESYYNRITFIFDTLKNALSYPVILLISIIILILFMIFVIIPSFNSFYLSLNIETPIVFKAITIITKYRRENPISFYIYIISWGVAIPILVLKPLLKKCKYNLPMKFKIVKEFYELIFISLISIIMSSGVNITNGLAYTANSFKSSILKEKFLNLNESILKGKSISETLEKSTEYSNYTIAVIKIGEEGGSIDERLITITSYLERKLIKKINKYLTIVQPMMILLMGGIVVTFLMIFVLPLFDLMLGSGL
jgi:type IV pilus assembly protein PilC